MADRRSDRPSRREFIALGLGAFVVAVAPRLRAAPRTVRRTVPVMGTVAEFAVVDPDPRHAEHAIDAAIDALFSVERTMTRFRADSDIGRVNGAAAIDAVRVGEPTATVVAEALRWARATGGRFDPAIGRLVAAWDVTHRREPLAAAVTQRFAERRLFESVEVGALSGTRVIRLHDADASLDLGGIAKGWGVDRAVAALRDRGIRHAIVNVGGDLYALGRSAQDDPWRVGVRGAQHDGALASLIDIEDRAIATSGDYEQGFDYAGRRYHHLLDPVTAEPRRVAMHSLTIAANDCMSADAAATALFGEDTAVIRQALARLLPGASLVHSA